MTSVGAQASGRADRDGEVLVLAAVIRREARWLLARRPEHKRHGGLWEFPGGKLLPGESWAAAAARELQEELAVELVAAGEPLARVRDPGSAFLIAFVPVQIRGEPRPIEHSEVRWLSRQELADLELAPADRRFVDSGALYLRESGGGSGS